MQIQYNDSKVYKKSKNNQGNFEGHERKRDPDN